MSLRLIFNSLSISGAAMFAFFRAISVWHHRYTPTEMRYVRVSPER
jgi:hypothetical protein